MCGLEVICLICRSYICSYILSHLVPWLYMIHCKSLYISIDYIHICSLKDQFVLNLFFLIILFCPSAVAKLFFIKDGNCLLPVRGIINHRLSLMSHHHIEDTNYLGNALGQPFQQNNDSMSDSGPVNDICSISEQI